MIKETTYRVPCIKDKLKTDMTLRVFVPGSKSITNRALLLAALADGTSVLDGVLYSDDSRHFIECIKELGFSVKSDEVNKRVTVEGLGGEIPRKQASIYVGSAGTAARFLAAYLGVSDGTYHLDASGQMKKRPMAPLLASLRQLGCKITFDEKEDYFPFTLESHGFAADRISVNIDTSSQFLSALLISSSLSKRDLFIDIEGTHGLSYINITETMMRQFGREVIPHYSGDKKRLSGYEIPSGQTYKPLCYDVEPDVSAACYFYALCPLLSIPVLVEGVHADSMQGDMQFINIMELLGCKSEDTRDGILLLPPDEKIYPGIDIDMSCCSDQTMTMAALAPFAASKTTIRGIGHIKFQECNRMAAIVTELTRMGIKCECDEDSITIYPGSPKPVVVNTYDDHRVAMSFTLIGLRAENIVISNPSCCRKTFENYFETLDNVVASLLKR